MNPLRLVFCGTPEFAVPSLRHLLAHPRFSVEAVITQPDRPQGRGREVLPSPVKSAALEAGVHIYQPETIRSDSAFDFFQRIKPDAVIIIAYGQIIPGRLIELPRLGWINLHGSLLPKYRGAAPIAWAIANGETITGLTTMQIDAGMDTGPILLQQEIPIGPDESEPELRARMSQAGPDLIVNSLLQLNHAQIIPRPQNAANATYAPILKKEHGRIDWSSDAQFIYNKIRALTPWPGAFTTFRGKLCHIWGHPAIWPMDNPSTPPTHATAPIPGTILATTAATITVMCGDNTCLNVQALQSEGRNRVTAAEFLNGARLQPNERFAD